MADNRYTKESKLGAALGLARQVQEEGFTGVIKEAIRGAQGDGVSARTKLGIKQATGAGNEPAEVLEEGPRADHGSARRHGATIKLPNGNMVTAIEYQKLQEALLKRR